MKCQDLDLSDNCMVIGTSAIVNTEIDGAYETYHRPPSIVNKANCPPEKMVEKSSLRTTF